MAASIFPQGDERSPMFVLMAPDGRFATCDTRTGPQLTTSAALSYCWPTLEQAEAHRPLYESFLGVPLAVEAAGGAV